jgi:TRAP transporter TAXI family solute receptor
MRRAALLIIAVLLTIIAIAGGAFYFLKPKATLRIATGHQGGVANRFVNALTTEVAAEYPRLRFETVDTPDLAASAKAIETSAADLAVIRTDAAAPINGETLAILRHDIFAIVTPAKTDIEKIPNLAQKTIGIPESYLQNFNEQALDTILSFYDIPSKSVRRLFIPMADIGRALAEKRIAAVFTIGPVGPGAVVDVVTAVKTATRSSPKVLAIEEADAISKRFPAFEPIEVPAGAFKGRPPIPDDSVSTLAVTYRLVAPDSMLDIVAGAIARTVLKSKTKLMQASPLMAEIEAPDTDKKTAILPVHPGVVAYLESGEKSFFNEFQSFLYPIGLALSAIGSMRVSCSNVSAAAESAASTRK